MNSNTITKPQWRFVEGTLSSDGRQINWSNGTYIGTRCDNGGVGGGGGGDWHRRPNPPRTWYRDGDRFHVCSINQRGNNLTFTNEPGVAAQAKFLGNKNVTASWNGQTINSTWSRMAARLTGATELCGAAGASTGSLARQTGIY